MAESCSAPSPAPAKPVVVRVKWKPFHSPLDAFCKLHNNSPFFFFFFISLLLLFFSFILVFRVGNQWKVIQASSPGFQKPIHLSIFFFFFSLKWYVVSFLFLSILFSISVLVSSVHYLCFLRLIKRQFLRLIKRQSFWLLGSYIKHHSTGL